MPPQKGNTTVVVDRYGRQLPYAAALPVTAQQAAATPGTTSRMTQQLTTAGDDTAGIPSSLPVQGLPEMAPSMTEMKQPTAAEGTVQSINRNAIGAEDSFHDRLALRRSFVDITAQPWFSHAADYHSLSGQLPYSKTENRWRLRYASMDENDPYGGEVTLVDYPPLQYLKDGQYVRVNGHLVDPDRKEYDCSFRVASMQPVQNSGEPLTGDANAIKAAGLPH